MRTGITPISRSGAVREYCRRRRAKGYSLIEVLLTVLIIQIISGMIMVNVSDVQTNERLARSCEQIVLALRYARVQAMSTGQPVGVEFNVSGNSVRVFQGPSATTVSDSMIAGGTYVINLNNQAETSGVRLSGAMISNDATDPYRVTFSTLGGTSNNGYVTLTYGGVTKTVQIPLVGEAKVQ